MNVLLKLEFYKHASLFLRQEVWPSLHMSDPLPIEPGISILKVNAIKMMPMPKLPIFG